MPEQFDLATIHALQDDLIALYNGKRGQRQMLLEPRESRAEGVWGESGNSYECYVHSDSAASFLVFPVRVAQGDRLDQIDVYIFPNGSNPVSVTLYSVNSSGTRTSLGSGTTGANEKTWTKVTITPAYTVAADTTVVGLIDAANTGDIYSGSVAWISHP